MTGLQSLSMFVTERLTLAAQEIFKAVEVTVTEYHEEISRSRQENELLRRRLLEAGIDLYPDIQHSLSSVHNGEASTGQPTCGEQWVPSSEELQVKLELNSVQEEAHETPPQIAVADEPSSPKPCMQNEQRLEDVFHAPTTDSSMDSLLLAGPFVQVKEEPRELVSDLGSETLSGGQSSLSAYPNDCIASSHAGGLGGELDGQRLSSMHRAARSKLPLMGKARVGRYRRFSSYDPVGQDKDLTQWRERSHMKRARGISKLPKVGRERKMELKPENQRMLRKKEMCPDVVLLDEEQSLPTQFLPDPGNMSEAVKQYGHGSLEAYRGPSKALGLVGANLCVVCGRTFSSRALLKIHLRVHSGEKPYHCHFCDKNFRQSSHLSVHVRIHTGEKPYSCPTCGKRFSDRSACNRHVKAHLEKDQPE